MERLTINIPETKIALVKQILTELGVTRVTISVDTKPDNSTYRNKLAKIAVWSDNDLKFFEKSFSKISPTKV